MQKKIYIALNQLKSLNCRTVKDDELENVNKWIHGIPLRFNKHSIGLLASIEGLFMELSNCEDDRTTLTFSWEIHGKSNRYEYTHLILGGKCFPFCAIFELQNCDFNNQKLFPLMCDAMLNSFEWMNTSN